MATIFDNKLEKYLKNRNNWTGKSELDVYNPILKGLKKHGIYLPDFFYPEFKKNILNGKKPLSKYFVVGSTVLEGVTFWSTDELKLKGLLNNAKNTSGKKGFHGSVVNNEPHGPLAASFLVTEGEGFREVYHIKESALQRMSPPLDLLGPINFARDGWDSTITKKLGFKVSAPKTSSLHLAIGSPRSNVHIDGNGFVVQHGLKVWISADAGAHLINEWFLKSFIKELLNHVKIGGVMDYISLDLPSTSNSFKFSGTKSLPGFKSIPIPDLNINIPVISYSSSSFKFKTSLSARYRADGKGKKLYELPGLSWTQKNPVFGPISSNIADAKLKASLSANWKSNKINVGGQIRANGDYDIAFGLKRSF